jgi:hypothetical protein
MLGRGAAVWNEWRAKHDEKPDLSGASIRAAGRRRIPVPGSQLRTRL